METRYADSQSGFELGSLASRTEAWSRRVLRDATYMRSSPERCRDGS